jgi:hypothetical protein
VLAYLLPDGVAWWVHISAMGSPSSRMSQTMRLAAVPGPRLTSPTAATRVILAKDGSDGEPEVRLGCPEPADRLPGRGAEPAYAVYRPVR